MTYYMKKLLLIITVSLLSLQVHPSELVIFKTSNFDESESLFKDPSVSVHYYHDKFIVATITAEPALKYISLDKSPWENNFSYYVVYFDKYVDKSAYFAEIEHRAKILFKTDNYSIIKTDESKFGQLPPAKNDGMARIFNNVAVLPSDFIFTLAKSYQPDPFILELFGEISGDSITSRVQHLENYETRNAYHYNSVLAQQWIESRFLEWGLDVEVMDFEMPDGPASDNVIATLVGTEYPDEFVVIGGHYDSISWDGDAPGADDNASGTSGVMEIARILSQYEFARSIIFCAFSGEEYGLYGSAAYAARSAENNKNILGYINMDMIGYLKPGNPPMTSLIYPYSATPLADFYTEVCSVYLPDFIVEPAVFTQGDSDHTSFNNNGYMGIFPFEDVNNYSPYIHTANDLVGPSYNNEDQAVIFTKAVLAATVKMATMQPPLASFDITEKPAFTKVLPNPASENIKLVVNSDSDTKLSIFNISGQLIYSGIIKNMEELNISDYKNGLYIFKFMGENFTESHKVIIN